MALTGIRLSGIEGAPTVNLAPTVLAYNQPSRYNASFAIPQNQPYTQPYWLAQPKDGALYSVPDPRDIGLPENPPVLTAHFRVQIAGTEIELTRPVQYRYVDRVYGEQVRPFTVIPPVAVSLPESALVFGDAKPRRIEVAVKSNGGKVAGDLRLDVPAGWTANPASSHFELAAAEEQTNVFFNLVPPAGDSRGPSQGTLRAIAQVGAQTVSTGTEVIQYPHITTQTLLPPAEATLVRADIRILSKTVGYVMGAGDEVPQAIRQLGCEVTLLTEARSGAWQPFALRCDCHRRARLQYTPLTCARIINDCSTMRITAERSHRAIQRARGRTSWSRPGRPWSSRSCSSRTRSSRARTGSCRRRRGRIAAHIGPYPIRIARNDRVTVEEAPIAFPNPDLRLLHVPNQITSADFEGWVQERGLYFATSGIPGMERLGVARSRRNASTRRRMVPPYGKGAYIFSAYSTGSENFRRVCPAPTVCLQLLSAGQSQ